MQYIMHIIRECHNKNISMTLLEPVLRYGKSQ